MWSDGPGPSFWGQPQGPISGLLETLPGVSGSDPRQQQVTGSGSLSRGGVGLAGCLGKGLI